MTLNEMEPNMQRLLAPTDCRLRPDIRAMENGDMGNDRHSNTHAYTNTYVCGHLVRADPIYLL